MAFDPSAFSDGYDDVRNDSTDTTFCLYKVAGKALEEVGRGAEGMAGLKAACCDTDVNFGFFRVIAGDDEGSARSKFVFVTVIGENVSPLQKGKTSVTTPAVFELAAGTSLRLEIRDLDDLNEEKVTGDLKKIGGAHTATDFKF